MSSSLRLEKVTPDNVEAAIALKVRPDQERFVSPVVKSLAEAYAQPETAWPRLVYGGDELVGFVMAFFDIRFDPDDPDDPDDRPRGADTAASRWSPSARRSAAVAAPAS